MEWVLVFLLGIKEKGKIFLVTNKHVINPDINKRHNTNEIKLLINSEDKNKIIKKDGVQINYEDANWKEHPDPDVDVYVLDVTQTILELPKIYFS